MNTIDIDHTCFLASDPISHPFLIEHLFSLDIRIWPENDQYRLDNRFDRISGALSSYPQIDILLQCRLLTEFLVFRRNMPAWAGKWLDSHLDLTRYLPGLGRRSLEKSSFYAVPVWVCMEQSRRRFFIVGLVPDKVSLLPDWAALLIDSSCREALETAAAAAEKQFPLPENYNLLCYPLTIENNTIQFTGGSLALPIALGFLSLLSGHRIAGHLAATGGLDQSGKVTSVGNLTGKARCAADRYHGMLYPLGNYPVAEPDNFDLIPVPDLESAWMMARLYTIESKKMLDLCTAMPNDPQLFVQNCNIVPIPWLTWINRNGKDRTIIKKIAASPELFIRLAESFEESLGQWDLEKCSALGNMIDNHALDRIQSIAPLCVFNWCRLNLALSNHLGKTSGADKWIERAASLIKQVMGMDVEIVTDYYNHLLVFQHNNYCFSASLPGELETVMALLERIHTVRQSEGCPVYPVLGRLYGTLAQHHGFCGPGHLQMVIEYSKKARSALGDPAVCEYKDNWMRQYCYLAYACLDAGLFEAAENHLLTYLAADNLQQAVSHAADFSIWKHALMARFLADTNYSKFSESYLQWAGVSENNPCKTVHPWQLWSLNMARIAQKAGDDSTACTLYQKSLDLCLAGKSGPAIRVMALMPLASLEKMGVIEEKLLTEIKSKIMAAAGELDGNHFKALKNMAFKEVVVEAGKHPERLFPFTYR